MIGIDIFAGAGGMSIGAAMAGIDVRYAVELNPHAAATFSANHRGIELKNADIRGVRGCHFNACRKYETILFGGPPCQGFSTSNQKTRNAKNEKNWLYREFIRLAKELKPEWVLFENVKGLLETENGYFLMEVLDGFASLGYTVTNFVLNSADFGVPQKRNRLFIIGSRSGILLPPPPSTSSDPVSVGEAISDLPALRNGDAPDLAPYRTSDVTPYAKLMRRNLKECWNNVVTRNADYVIERYRYIPQGGNWEDIPERLMRNYRDASRCHTGIYRRLREDEPSVVIGNFRKNMLIHPWEDRGLSVREAARLQSIPDWFRFIGSIGFQQQQVGNLVPPLLAKSVFQQILACSGAIGLGETVTRGRK